MEIKVTIEKALVLEALHKNMEEHKRTFQKAMEVYRQKAIEAFEAKIDALKNGRWISHTLNLPIPEEHTNDFQRVINMLQRDINDTVELTENDYRVYIDNEWNWQRAFLSNTTAYLGAAPPKADL